MTRPQQHWMLACFCVLSLVCFTWTQAVAQDSAADVTVAQAVLAYDEKQYAQALTLLDEVLAQNPQHVEALYYKGLVFIATGKPEQAIPVLEQAAKLRPEDAAIRYHLGAAYFSLQQYEKAEPILSQVYATNPGLENLGYYMGFMRYRQKNYQGALEAFERGQASDPTIQQLTKFYRGLALAVTGLSKQAARELEEANRIRTVSPLTGPADRLRDTILTAQDREGRLHGEFRVGGYYDSNVAINPKSAQDPLVASLRSRRTNTPGELFSARGDYAWYRSEEWEANVFGSYFKTINNEVSFFNIDNALGGTGLTHKGTLASLPFFVTGQYTFDYTALHGRRFLSRHSGTLIATLVENAGNLTSIQGRIQVKDFADRFLIGGGGTEAENRDATNWMIGVSHMFRFSEDRHFIRLGYQYDVEDAKGIDWFYHGHRFLAGGLYTLPWETTRLRYDFDFHYRRYPYPNAVFPPNAPDTVRQNVREQNHVFRIEQSLPYGFVIAADYQATLSRANLPFIFNYNRHIGTLSLAWGF